MFDFINPETLYQIVYQFVFQLTLAVTAPLRSNSDIYWAYLLSALLLGLLVTASQHAQTPSQTSTGEAQPFTFIKGFFNKHFSASLWTHPSALLDMRFYFVNAIVFPCLFAPIALQSPVVVDLLSHISNNWTNWTSLSEVVQPSYWTDLGVISTFAVKALYTALFFVAYDGGRFLAHSLLHDNKWLWEFHKIHHSAQVLTPFTSFRVHPVDLIIMVSVPALTTGLVTWLFICFVSKDINFYTLLDLHIFICLFNCVDNLRHWNVWLTYPAPFDRWLISPAHHQLHHSAAQEHWGCNRGFELAIWDRLCKTIITPSKTPMNIKLGLGDEDQTAWKTLTHLYWNPFKSLFKQVYTHHKV